MEVPKHQIDSCDYISDLPDNILHHILSFLAIKDLIRTSFISRRWRCLWTSVPTLDFDGLVFSPKIKFANFVDSVLHRRDICSIEKFRLRFALYYCTNDRVQSWIRAAISHNVAELSVSSYSLHSFLLPNHIFTCTSLTVLTLNLNHSTLSLPSAIHLPSLKTLLLSSLIFDNDNLSQLFSSSPILETVHIEGCLLSDIAMFHISSTSLQRLIISGLSEDLSLYNGKNARKIRIFTPNLLSIEYTAHLIWNVSLENLTSLITASIDLNIDSVYQRCDHHGVNLLKGVANAEVLKLSSASIKFLSATPTLSLMGLPKFSKLKHLEVSLAVSRKNVTVLVCFLHISPTLEVLWVELSRGHLFEENVPSSLQDSQCEVGQLKIVKIRGFHGGKQEIAFVNYLSEHACKLERMAIIFSKLFCANSERQMKIKENILTHPRGSKNSAIDFVSMQ